MSFKFSNANPEELEIFGAKAGNQHSAVSVSSSMVSMAKDSLNGDSVEPKDASIFEANNQSGMKIGRPAPR